MTMHAIKQIVNFYDVCTKNFPSDFKYNIRRSLIKVTRLFPLVFLLFELANSGKALALFVEEQKLLGVGGDSVAINGNRVVIGDPSDGNNKGAAYVYRYDSSTMTWVEEQKLIATDGQAGDGFGFSLGATDGRIVVGAPTDSDNGLQSGSIYIFRFDPVSMTWVQEQKIIALDGEPNDWFGFSTTITSEHIAVGAPFDDDKASRSGAVYIYRFNPLLMAWAQEQKLIATDATEESSLGWSVAIHENRIVAGAIETNNCGCNPPRSGSAYVFHFDENQNAWTNEAKLTASDGQDSALFGYSVGITFDRVVVGTIEPAGYVFRYNEVNTSWNQEQKITGASKFAIDSDRIVGGNPFSGASGTAYVHKFDSGTMGWVPEQQLTVFDSSQFGRSVDMSGDLIAVGYLGGAAIFRFTPDSDGDGVQDEQDQCPNSDIRATIIINTCDSGVANALLTEPAGCTITDEILSLAVDAHSHGQFVSKVDKFLLELQNAGVLEQDEKHAVKDCAAQSSLP